MIWSPETPEELAEAQRFYEDARNFNSTSTLKRAIVAHSAEEKVLIQAILKEWDNVPLRLQYAELLSRRGDSLGEYIPLSHALATMNSDDRARESMVERQNQLLREDYKLWMAPLIDLGIEWEIENILLLGFNFDSGFVEELYINKPGILPQQAERLFAAAPFLQMLSFTYENIDVPGIARLPQLGQIKSLELDEPHVSLQDVVALASAQHLESLQELHLWNRKFGPPLVETLIGASWFPSTA